MMRSPISTPPLLLVLPLLPTLLFLSLPPFLHSLTTDGLLLLSLKYSILNDPLHVLDTWTPYADTPCSWQGVTCDVSVSTFNQTNSPARVIAVSLPGSQLLGSLPADLGLLDHLQSLNLSSNSINGSIPDSLYALHDLRVLDLSDNLISGPVSDLAGGLRSLETLNLSDNAMDGNIPRNLAALGNLTEISLRGNYFSGFLPGGFDRVRFMDLSSNLINGSLPTDFGGRSIHYLNVSDNRISGEIPPEFAKNLPENSTLDFSYNNLTGEIPDFVVFINQEKDSFVGNSDLCGPPSGSPCPIPSSPTSLPMASYQPIPPPAIAAIPKGLSSPEESPAGGKGGKGRNNGLRPHIIAAIVVGDLAGIAILMMLFLYVYNKRKNKKTTTSTISSAKTTLNAGSKGTTPMTAARELSSSSSSSSSSKGIAKWSCLRKGKSDNNEDEDDEEDEYEDEKQQEEVQQQGQLVTVDGDSELELETLLKASAYILGASGSSIMYKAVMEDGTVLAVRRVGECSNAERFKDFDGHVRAMAKLVHQNVVRVRGFYWGSDEKLLIYEYVPNGSLANARYRKTGSSPCHIPWEVRLRIAKGIARGLTYIHDKKHVHGNLKPSNILLDTDMEPKIGDLGLERFTPGKSGYIIPGGSTRHFGSKRSTASRESFQDYSVGATPSPSASSIGCGSPYHPPESLRSLKPNPKWDVYSFGVMLLELLTGKVVVSDELGPPVLAGLAVGLEDKNRVLRMADAAIRADLEGREEALLTCLKLGYNCVSHVPQKRPTMKEALQTLEKIPTSSTPSSSSYYYGP